MDFHACLRDHRRYERQIDRLHTRYSGSRRLYEIQQDDVSLATIVLQKSKVAKILARTVASGRYQFEPGWVRSIRVDGKQRTIFAYRLTDLIMHGVIAGIIQEAMTDRLSRDLYSYRKGISWWMPVSRCAAYIRSHRKAHPNPRDRGLYVLRRDVNAYTDSIPVGHQSPVWQMIRDLFTSPGRGSTITESDWSLIQKVVRADVFLTDGARASVLYGVPTGQPISCVLFNLYLSPLDDAISAVPGAFYARYSDDLVFAHPDPDIVRQAGADMDLILTSLQLSFNHRKTENLYLTGAGRASAHWADATGSTSIPLLGTRIAADGTVSLNTKKARALLRDLEDRATQTATLVKDRDVDDIGRTVCSAVNRALDPRATLFQQRTAALLRRAVTDRRQLAQLDYCIARIALRAVTADHRVRAFRQIPYRRIREDWGLVSLLHARNTCS